MRYLKPWVPCNRKSPGTYISVLALNKDTGKRGIPGDKWGGEEISALMQDQGRRQMKSRR